MISRSRRFGTSLVALGLLAATLFAVQSLATPGTAEARCNGVTKPVRSNFVWGGVERVSETPRTNTCDGNQTYTATLRDEAQDGYCVSVWFEDAGYISRSSAVCGNGNYLVFASTDINGNSYSYEWFCVHPASHPGDIAACGWGGAVDGYGVNHGY